MPAGLIAAGAGPAVAATLAALSDATLAAYGIGIEHHFGGGAYIKATHMLAGQTLGQHAHAHDHLSVLVHGTVRLYVEGQASRVLAGYQTLVVEAHKGHHIEAITDALWLCVWATDDTDPATVDESILKG